MNNSSGAPQTRSDAHGRYLDEAMARRYASGDYLSDEDEEVKQEKELRRRERREAAAAEAAAEAEAAMDAAAR